MKVYVVITSSYPEDKEIAGIFTTREGAERFIAEATERLSDHMQALREQGAVAVVAMPDTTGALGEIEEHDLRE